MPSRKIVTAFITGANRGIGLGLIKKLAEDRQIKHLFAGYYATDSDEDKNVRSCQFLIII